jgi:hypothetical protein
MEKSYRVASFICFELIILSTLVSITFGKDASQFKVYVNRRFTYTISYPYDIFIPQGEAANGDGQIFLSKDRRAVMKVYGSNNSLEQSIDDRFAEEFGDQPEGDSERIITYKVVKKDWYVISGIEGDSIFYKKIILKGDVFLTFEISYPKSSKHIFDRIIEHIVQSFKYAGP